MIIFLNGTSSVGKTTIARNLQQVLTSNWLYLDMDHFLDMLNPDIVVFDDANPSFLQKTDGFYAVKDIDGYHIEVGKIGEKILSDMVDQVANMASFGWNVIFAGVRPYKRNIVEIKEKLGQFGLLKVYLYADLGVIKRRESGRGDRLKGSTEELIKRFENRLLHDVEFDSGLMSSDEIVQEVLSVIRADYVKYV